MEFVTVNGIPALKDSMGNLHRIVERWKSEMADAIVAVSKGVGGPGHQIQTEGDWQVVEKLIRIYAHYFNSEYESLLNDNKDVRGHQNNKFGILKDSGSRNDANIRQLGTWPFELDVMIRTVWPDQKYDRKFTEKFFSKFPAFRTADKI